MRIVLDFILDSVKFVLFLKRVFFNGGLGAKITREFSGTAVLLANGPSLKDVLPHLESNEEFKNVDFVVLNFFAFEDVFYQIKPTHYCLADPMFYKESHNEVNVKKLFQKLNNEVTWQLKIYVSSNRLKDFNQYSQLKNPKLTIVPVSFVQYSGYEKYRNLFYKKGWAAPTIGTVANLAIYVALNCGYSEVNLYGVDHTFFDSLCVNENNILCNRDTHFYDKEKAPLKPILRNDNGEYWKMSEFLEGIEFMFQGHEQLANYSKYLGVQILNCTKNSMINCYNRKKE